jgi:F0F1-type ATP synthase assembly protein I
MLQYLRMSVKQATHKPITTPHPVNNEASSGSLENLKQLHIARELADVTWRLGVPVIGLCVLGIWADKSWNTKPWLTLLSTALGFVVAGKLVNQQIKRVTAEEERNV